MYSGILFVLFEQTQQHQQPISRDLAVDFICDLLTEDAMRATEDLSLDAIEQLADDLDAVRLRAGAILRYLTACGWLREEMDRDFTRTFTLPTHAFRILRVLTDLAANKTIPLQGLICAIYDSLQAALQQGDAHYRIPQAHEGTLHLLASLKELQHNIGAHLEQMIGQLQARDALEQFIDYRNKITDTAYHQLRTDDHVSRFRPGIFDALLQLEHASKLEEAARGLVLSGQAATAEDAADQLLRQLREIQERFDQLDQLLETIDVRNEQFVDRAVRTVEQQLAARTTVSGQLRALLSFTVQAQNGVGAAAEQTLGDMFSLFALELPDAQSPAPAPRAALTFTPIEIVPIDPNPGAEATARAQTLAQLRRSISRQRVQRLISSSLGSGDQLRASDLPLVFPDDLPLLIYVRQYGDGSLGYVTERMPESWIEREMIRFQDFFIHRVDAANRLPSPKSRQRTPGWGDS